jgi:FkbM family methyltransferase
MQGAHSAALIAHGNIRVKHSRFGLMLYNINDVGCGHAFDNYGEFSYEEAKAFAQLVKEGMTVLDVGAHIGAHTMFFSQAVRASGTVIALEPQRVLYQMLVANLALNEINNVRPLQAAAGAESGAAFVPPIDYNVTGSPGACSLSNEGGDPVIVMPIDSLALPQCHFIKIDVEGWERDVLIGAAATLAKFRPVLYIENDRREKSEALIRYLIDLGYMLYWHVTPLYCEENFYCNPINIYPKICSVNMLCMARETNPDVAGLQEIVDPTDYPLKPPSPA